MSIKLASSSLPRFIPFSPATHLLHNAYNPSIISFLFIHRNLTFSSSFQPRLSLPNSPNDVVPENAATRFLDDQILVRVAAAKDADEALLLISDNISGPDSGVIGTADCCSIIKAAIGRNNVDLALSVFYAMRSSFDQGGSENGDSINRWRWSRPDVGVYTTLIKCLAASLRVSDALKILHDICRVAISLGDEVSFGKVVRCPGCLIAVSVAQPQHGVQMVSCAKCRYQYELVTGKVVSITSEELSKNVPLWERSLRYFQINRKSIPSAVHSVVVQTPSGMARTHRFATETVDVPAQEGERVTIASAVPSNIYRNVGPFRFSPKAPDLYPGESLCLTNHRDGRESLLLRAPSKDGDKSLQPSFLIPVIAILATGDAASAFIDPSLPQLISVAAVSSLAVGAALNGLVLPRLNQLPERSVEVIAIKQQLLTQYDLLQSRIRDLKEAAEKEVWMLARMCQLENKIFAVGEPAYRTRRTRVKKVQEALENSLKGRIELIDSYARISSMIEIEVEMDSDVLAAEAASNVEGIAEQIQQIMELENLEEKWRLQAEANDEAERLLSDNPTVNQDG